MGATKRTKAPPRVRRSPEESRARILAVAQKLLSVHGPDAIGLKDVAREAEVSHALVSHYFGTWEGLVEAALEERARSLREALVSRLAAAREEEQGAAPLVEILFEAISNPMYGRLAAWTILSGRSRRADFFARRDRGLARVADAIEARARRPSRDEIEFLLTLCLTAAMGWSLGKSALLAGLDREDEPGRDAWFRDHLVALIERTLARK